MMATHKNTTTSKRAPMARKPAVAKTANTEPEFQHPPRTKAVNNTLRLRLDDLKTFLTM